MKKNIIVAAIAAASALLLTVSCQKEAQLETNSEGKTFTAVIDQNVTKTTVTESTIAGQYKVNWVSGDEININGAVYSATPDGTDATKASFTYVSGTTPTAPYTAIYPASLYNAGTFELPATQTYEAGKFNAPMYAESSTESLEFKNICGVICFSLKGTAKVKSIAFSSTDAVCGTFSMMDDATTMDLDLTGTGTTVTLDCGTGVQLNETTATNFYIYLPPRTYPIGTKIVITDTAGKVFTKITTERATIARSNIYTFDWTPTFVNEGPLSGKFSVSAGKQVQFSKGNLQATYDGSKYTWGFAANQYDYIGNFAGNTTIDSQTSGAVVDLFGWSTSATYFGINTSEDVADYSGDFVDWGKNIGDGSTWRTLSKDEWVYLFETRTNASSLYKKGVTVCGKTNCVIIAPDNWDTSANPLQDSYDATAWAIAEAAGLVCLPAAGFRFGSGVISVGDYDGFYWSSTAFDSGLAFSVYFLSSDVVPDFHYGRCLGGSVRLITDVAGSAPEEPVIDPLSGKFSVSSTEQVQFSKGNLQATYDGSKYTWGFAANQYDYIGNAAGNTTIDSQTSGAVVDLFGWSTEATKYGISTSTYNGDYSGDFVDWGNNIGDGSTWRTLSKNEWTYLFNTRTNASKLYKYGVTVCGKDNCVIIAPDNWDISANPLQTSYDATTWSAAEAAGLICLPAAGFRNGSSVGNVGDYGYYWSSSASGSYSAYLVLFDSSHVTPDSSGYRLYGRSVRLITESK